MPRYAKPLLIIAAAVVLASFVGGWRYFDAKNRDAEYLISSLYKKMYQAENRVVRLENKMRDAEFDDGVDPYKGWQEIRRDGLAFKYPKLWGVGPEGPLGLHFIGRTSQRTYGKLACGTEQQGFEGIGRKEAGRTYREWKRRIGSPADSQEITLTIGMPADGSDAKGYFASIGFVADWDGTGPSRCLLEGVGDDPGFLGEYILMYPTFDAAR